MVIFILSKIIPEAKLYDPSDDLVKAIKNHISEGEGKIHSIISESEKYPADEFLKILDILKIKTWLWNYLKNKAESY